MTRYSVMIAAVVMLVTGCAYMQSREQTTPAAVERPDLMKPDSAKTSKLAFDPMGLGPSVFTRQESVVQGDLNRSASAPVRSVTGYRVQLGAFIDQKLAEGLAERAEKDLGEATYVVFDRPFFRVRAGDFRDLSEAEALKSVAISRGYQDARIAHEEIVVSD